MAVKKKSKGVTALAKINARVKQLKRSHPNTAHRTLQKQASAQLKSEGKIGKVKKNTVKKVVHRKKAVSGVKRKKAAPTPRKVKVKIKTPKKNRSTIIIGGIAGVSLNKAKSELQHQEDLKKIESKHRDMLKTKGLKTTEKAAIRRDIKKAQDLIRASKKNVSAYKKYI